MPKPVEPASMRKESANLFWLSYSDLFTALFFIMLALFVMSYKLFKDREARVNVLAAQLKTRSEELDKRNAAMDQLQQRLSTSEYNAYSLIEQLESERQRLYVMEEEFKKLQEIQMAISALNPQHFEYQTAYKRHVLRSQVQFDKGSSQIKSTYHAALKSAGQELQKLVTELVKDPAIKYILVIEGQASRDNYTRNYELSYERALALFQLWNQQGISFDPNRVEVIISGSGTGGVGRESSAEEKNQRFLIQIMPKIGELKTLNP